MPELAIDRYKRETALYLARACKFRRALSAPEWSEQVRRMANGKRFRFDFAPYQREMMETPFRQDVHLTVYQMASRMGKTEVFMNVIGHSIAEVPRRILVMYPSISQAEKWSKETFSSELVNPTPELSDLIGDGEGKRKSGNTILHKIFPGGVINIFGASSPGEMRRAKGNLLIADEIDAFASTQTDEGDPLEIFWVRGSEYSDTIKIAASYPSVKGASKIEALLLQSDFRVWKVPCPNCREEFVLHRRQLRYDRHKPEDAWIECPANACRITDSERVQIIQAGRWEATRPFSGVAGFHGSRMMSPHPPQKGFLSHLHWAAVEEMKIEKAEDRERAKRVLINTFDAETYQAPEEEKPDPMGLAADAYDYLAATGENSWRIPAGVLVVTMGVDVQGDRLEAEFVGFGLDGQEYGLGYHVVNGNSSEPEVWRKLDKLTVAEFHHPSGRTLRAACVFIDSKFRSDFVRAFTRDRQARGIYSIIGSTVLGKPIVGQGKMMGRDKVFEIGTHECKALIYQNSRLRRDKKTGQAPQNYMHFPLGFGYGVEYFQRLLVEEVELKKASDGSFQQFFSNPNRLRNEPLDVRVYAKAACRKLNPAFEIIAKKMAGNVSNNGGNRAETLSNPRNFVID
jgi:phage terminase large subunit GpA-like protein